MEFKPHQSHLDYKKKLEELRNNFLKKIEALEGQIEKLNAEKEELKISYKKTLKEMKEKHAKELDVMENTHVHEIFQAFTEQEVLEKKIEELRKDYMEKLNEEEDNLFRTMNIKLACDKQLQEQKDKLQQVEAMVKELQEKLESGFNDAQLLQELQAEKETCSDFKTKMNLMKQQFVKIKEEMQLQNFEFNMLKEEMQRLHNQLKNGKKLKSLRKVKKLNNTFQEQEINLQDIVEMHEQNKIENEVALTSINNQLYGLIHGQNRLTGQTAEPDLEPVKTRIEEKTLFFRKLMAEMAELNARNQEALLKMRKKLKVKEIELCTERQNVRNTRILVERIKADIQTCSDFIQQPQKLKMNFVKLFKRYIKGEDVRVREKTEQEHSTGYCEMEQCLKNPYIKPRPFEPRLPAAPNPKKRIVDGTEDQDTNPGDSRKHSWTMKIDAGVSILNDSSQKFGGYPMMLPQMLGTRSQRFRTAIQIMKQGQDEQQSSSCKPSTLDDPRAQVPH
ncbi:cilia- and flagella-associated protein 57-like isoform X2 [Tachysurus vachellii]|uniref:cilia- and flagella-associated protein 57-like isoform X2 n=1 Tax=Tachysurus vachellii TaxID=175792 RepID=UPI00296B3974|nr:cilia- and flagella-associated protein 57-like isoform X2 [Tachysurus vachellii]